MFWSFLGLSSALLFPVAVLIYCVTAPFDRRLTVLHRFTCFWASLYTWTNPLWRVTIEGRKKIPPSGTPAVLVANHESFVDILVLFRLFRHFKWVSKAEMFRIPAIGWNMRLNRYIRLVRGDPQSIEAMMSAASRTLDSGSSVMIFPEGTRSPDGQLKPFKLGAFTLALERRVPLVPIVLAGTAQALPKRGFVLRGRSAIRVRVLDAIPYAEFATKSAADLADLVRARMKTVLEAKSANAA